MAFANSTPISLPAVLFIGVNDDGEIAPSVDVEKTLQAFSDYVAAHAWPPIHTLPRVLNHQGKSCIAVIVFGSPDRPHFAGRSWVRAGTQTKDASDAQFAELIVSHTSKAREILKRKGQYVTVIYKTRGTHQPQRYDDRIKIDPVAVDSCNAHYVTLVTKLADNPRESWPLATIELAFDHEKDRLCLWVYKDR